MGRVDGIILQLEEGRPPRVAYVELGVRTMMNRLSPRLGKTIARLMKKAGISSDPHRVAWSKLHVGLNAVHADIEAENTPALKGELWLREKIKRVPGAAR
jgi:hypothetical protein